MIKSVAIIANPKSKDIKPMVTAVVDFLKRRRVDILLDKRAAEVLEVSWCSPDEVIHDTANLIVVLGGDGTALSAARLSGEKEIPILGVHMGNLGFITEIGPDEVLEMLGKTLDGTLPVQRRMRLCCEIVNSAGETVFNAHALNEIALSKGAIARMIEFNVSVNDIHMGYYRADGYLVSTPTGSTAYSLSAGGPVVWPLMPLMLLSAICPHTLDNRPMIIPAESIVKIDLCGERQDIFVSNDGQVGRNLQSGDSLLIKRTSFDTLLHIVPGRNFFEHLRSKFGWGD